MEDISLHILDLAENATAAGATLVEIDVVEVSERNLLRIRIRDNGRGMDSELLENVRDPFVTTRTTRRVGLGISLMEQAAREAGGTLTVASEKGKGTEVTATFQADHIDRKPLGDMGATAVAIIMGSPDADIVFSLDADGWKTRLDTREIRSQLDAGTPLTHPVVLEVIRGIFKRETTGGTADDGGRKHG